MSKQLKTYWIEETILKTFDELCEKNRMKKGATIEEIMKQYIVKYIEKQNPQIDWRIYNELK